MPFPRSTHPLRNDEAQTGPAVLAACARVSLLEGLEQQRDDVFGNAYARVLYDESEEDG